MRQEVWYPLGGLAMLAWLVLGLQALITLPLKGEKAKKAVPWVNWILGVIASLLSLAAGFYATKNTWIEHIIQWFVGLHPAVPLVVGLGCLALIWFLALGVVPDDYAAVTLGAGLIIGAFFLPNLAKHAVPPGSIGDHITSAVEATTDFAVDQTQGWFTAGPTQRTASRATATSTVTR